MELLKILFNVYEKTSSGKASFPCNIFEKECLETVLAARQIDPFFSFEKLRI